MVGLKDAILVRSELLKLLLEQLSFLVGNCLFVEDENIADVVVVYL